uniref:Pectinesterase inhibitor domain-containing protein n=1 Tax=Fagus sylvatica TaxID=28930 RepID=A0A2N9EE23_FAGSY
MNFRTLLLIFVVVVAILSHTGVKATRVLCEDFASANHLDIDTSTSVYAKAKYTMAVAILSHTGVKATRVLCEDFASANHLDIDTSTSVYAKAKYTMAGWLKRLPSGPSNGGSAH